MRHNNLSEKTRKKIIYKFYYFITLIKILRLRLSLKFLVFLSNLKTTFVYHHFWTFLIYKNFIKSSDFFYI